MRLFAYDARDKCKVWVQMLVAVRAFFHYALRIIVGRWRAPLPIRAPWEMLAVR